MPASDDARGDVPADEPPLASLIEELRRIERRRVDATPGSSEYIEVLGFERTLAERIRQRIDELDRAPYWAAADAPERRAGR
jgi:hypothetical protein